MGTRFRTMLAPINASTGDGRRFATDSITLAETPFPFEWARSREGGHDGAVVVGAVQEAHVGTVKEAVANGWISADKVKGMDQNASAVWGIGELFDSVSREEMPRLAEDVAEAMHLMTNGTLGPSVDLDTFEGVPVKAGTDEPLTYEDFEAEYEETGEEPKVELLITSGRVRAATLVSIPAFAETCRPLELIVETEPQDEAATVAVELALVASVGTRTRPAVAAFSLPVLTGPTPITWDWERGTVYGHIATWKTCHVGYEGVCVTPPRDGQDGTYAWFNRHPVETEDGGTVWAGRITVGGRHAGLALNASATMSVYDQKATAAHVRAYEDEFGIVVAGVIEPGLKPGDRQILDRRKVSGDWRETPAGLSLVEVLALSPGPRSHSEPGFPVVETFSRGGRQVALTAAISPDPDGFLVPAMRAETLDIEGAFERVLARREARAALAATITEYDTKVRSAAREALSRALTAGEG